MARCYICGCELDVESTKPEHIIPNGIGGKLKSREILCDKHNNELFELDQIICKDLENHTNRLNPSRDNGKNPATSYALPSGEKVIMQPNGEYYAAKPEIQVNKAEDGKIEIKFSTYYSTGSQHKEFALNQLKNIVEGVCRKNKFPEDAIQKELDNLEETFEKSIQTDFNPVLKGQFQFNSSGRLFLGLAKIALDYYFYNKLPEIYVKEFLNKFKEQDITYVNKNANYYYEDNLFKKDSIYHTLILNGDSNNNLLYCIISLYGVLNCIVFLNRNYSGNDFFKTYSYDLRNREVVNVNPNLTITQSMVEHILERKELFDKIKNAQDVFMSFFKYGSKEELQKDFEEFAIGLDNEIKDLQKKPILNSLEEYEKSFQQIFNKKVQENKTLKQLTKHELQGLYQVMFNTANYELYLKPYVLNITNDIITKSLCEILLNNPNLIDDNEILITHITDFYMSFKTENETVNKMLQENTDNVKECIKAFIPSIKPQLEYYRKILDNG